MKNRISVFAALACFLCSGEALAGDCFSLSLSLPSPSFQVGEVIPLTFALKNCGSDMVTRQYYGGKIRGYTDYLVSVERSDGHTAERTEDYKEAVKHESLARVMIYDIAPGKTVVASGDLQTMFQLEEPGTYHVIATSKVPDSITGPEEVRSNMLTLVVEPKS